MSTPMEDAAARLTEVRARIAQAAARVGRDPAAITLVGVAKRQPLERIVGAVRAGLGALGENFVQEARAVRPQLESALGATVADAATLRTEAAGASRNSALRWHMVGRLQSNKLGLVARLFDVVESLDRLEHVAPLARHAREAGRELEVLIQVAVGDEPQKGGCAFDAVPELARAVAREGGLQLRGLMAVPPASEDPEASRPHFRRLRAARDDWAAALPGLDLGALSMGMSGDFEVAVEEGATLVRVGTALFGPRTNPN